MSAMPEHVVEGQLLPKGEVPNTPKMRAIQRLEAAIPLLLPEVDVDAMTSHHFCDGLYVRQMTVPAGVVLVGKIHKHENFFLLVKGDMTVLGDSGNMVRVRAPYMIVTEPGTKRVGFAHSECIVLNIHGNPDDERDVATLEDRLIIPEVPPTLPPSAAHKLIEGDKQ